MAYHQWLSSTSEPQPTPGSMGGQDVQMSDSPPPLAQHKYPGPNDGILLPDALGSSPDDYGYNQAVHRTTGAQSGEAVYERSAEFLLDSHHHPSLRLSHIEHSAQVDVQMAQRHPSDHAKAKYHEAMQRTTGVQWSHQMSKAFAYPDAGSRDSAGCEGRPPRPSGLAATHPGNYVLRGPQNMPPLAPPPLSSFEEFMSQMTTSRPEPISPLRPSPEPPWRLYADPMRHTSQDPHFWGKNGTILRSDRHLELGNVIS